MEAPGEKSTTTTTLLPSSTLRLLSQTGMSSGRVLERQNLLKQNMKQPVGKVVFSESRRHFFSHGLRRLEHFSLDSPVRFMVYSEDAGAFISLHSDNTVCLYKANGFKQTVSAHLPFMGLTATKIPGCLVGWGPGPIFTLLDSELCPVDTAHDGLDIRVCQAAEHSSDLVTAGAGNVCVWSVMLMRCTLKIQDGLQHSMFTHMALAPPTSDRHHRAFVACGKDVTVVDLSDGRVLEHKQDLCSRDITVMVYCFQLDCLIIASQELSIRVWGPNWEPRVDFCGHKGEVNSLFYCSELSMLISSSVDCTIRCWNVEDGDALECIHTEQKTPPLYIGGTRKGDTLFSFSHQRVDFWTIRTLYTLHCQLRGDEGAPLRQILVPPFPAPYPTRLICVSGDSNITLVAAETGAVLTSFIAKNRILCADYCLHKEILLALTEAGTVLQANTLTNPVTLMQEWKSRSQGPWQPMDHVTEDDSQNLPFPGPACCLVLYSCVTDTQRALDEWRHLQERRRCSHRNKAVLDDAKNKFMIILGQSGGCVSVLKMDNGNVICRMPAHNGQKVTSVQVYPENSSLLSTGEDLTVVVWRVNPYVDECLSQQLSLQCGQSPVYLAALGSLLALTFQDPNSEYYILKHFNLLNQSQTDYQPRKGHLDRFTGLCVFPDWKIFVSSSLDKTIRIWNEENHLIRTLQLNAVPECVGYSGFGGEVFLGIRGDLYRMNCAKLLPRSYQQTPPDTCVEPPSDLPIPENKETYTQKKTSTLSKNEDWESQVIATNHSLTEDMLYYKESLEAMNMDLEALLQGTVKCKKGKPPSTKQTRKEAFDSYMKIIYGLPRNIKIDLEDTFEPDTLSFHPRPHSLPRLKEDVHPQPKQSITVTMENKKKKKASATIKKVRPVEKVIPEEPKPQPVEKIVPSTPIIEEKNEEPPESISPIEQLKPKTPTPPRSHPRTPPWEPSPEVPKFLKQFAGMEWFSDLYPDKKCIPRTLSPEDFSLHLLNYLQTCVITSRMKILTAMQTLHSQGLLQNTDRLYQGLIDSVCKFARPHMSPVEQTTLAELLNLLMRLKPPSYDLVRKLLTLLAYKKLGLRETVMRMLGALGVNEAEEWLWPKLESWDSELEDQSDTWMSLHGRVDCWLELWISKYKEHNRYLYLRSTAKWKPSTLSIVDVLNYFCLVQKEEDRKARHVAPTGSNNTVLLPLYDCSSRPILRLGETYSMARIRKPPGIILPPLRNRPFLMHFPLFIYLPLPRVTLSPFHHDSDEDQVRASTQRYFIQEQSLVEYYRQCL